MIDLIMSCLRLVADSPQPSLAIAPVALAAIGAAAAKGIGSLVGNASQNRTNARIASQTNQANMQIAADANRWNESMWNKQNAYNDPKAQMNRWRSAGINPYFALGNMDAGLAQTAQPAQTATMQPYQQNTGAAGEIFGSLVGSGISIFGNTNKELSDQQRVSNETLRTSIENFKEMRKSGISESVANDYLRNELQMHHQDIGNVNWQKSVNGRSASASARSLEIQNDANEWSLFLSTVYDGKHHEQRISADAQGIAKAVAETANFVALEKLNSKEVEAIAARCAEMYAHARHMNASTETINQMRQYLVKQISQQCELSGYNVDTARAVWSGDRGVRDYISSDDYAKGQRKEVEADNTKIQRGLRVFGKAIKNVSPLIDATNQPYRRSMYESDSYYEHYLGD